MTNHVRFTNRHSLVAFVVVFVAESATPPAVSERLPAAPEWGWPRSLAEASSEQPETAENESSHYHKLAKNNEITSHFCRSLYHKYNMHNMLLSNSQKSFCEIRSLRGKQE